jgi:hypothetical protein
MKNNWVQSANDYFLKEVSQQSEKLPVGVYIAHESLMGMYLTRTADEFVFPYKVYGVEREFIERVKRTYRSTNNNLGLLLNGVKGTGKTVTAQIICNELQLPVIIVTANMGGLPDFLSKIQQDVVVFIDEYEKIYSDRDHSVLTVMDGVLNCGHRRTFVLTTNNLWVNENMLQRPGRIRYLKTFSDMPLSVITEIVDDMLTATEHRKATIDFISGLEHITIDIIKAIISEVNIHHEDPLVFKDVFNVTYIETRSYIWEVTMNKKKSEENLVYSDARISPTRFTSKVVGQPFIIDEAEVGTITDVIGDNLIKVALEDDDNIDSDGNIIPVTYRISQQVHRHRSFGRTY